MSDLAKRPNEPESAYKERLLEEIKKCNTPVTETPSRYSITIDVVDASIKFEAPTIEEVIKLIEAHEAYEYGKEIMENKYAKY